MNAVFTSLQNPYFQVLKHNAISSSFIAGFFPVSMLLKWTRNKIRATCRKMVSMFFGKA